MTEKLDRIMIETVRRCDDSSPVISDKLTLIAGDIEIDAGKCGIVTIDHRAQTVTIIINYGHSSTSELAIPQGNETHVHRTVMLETTEE